MTLTANMGSTLAAKYGRVQTYTAGAVATLGTPIYRGATVALKQGDGLVYPAELDADDSEKYLIVGFAMEEAATDGAAIRVRQDGKLKRKLQGTIKVGQIACVYDDEAIQVAASGLIVVGRVTELIGTTDVYVDLENAPSRLASSAND